MTEMKTSRVSVTENNFLSGLYGPGIWTNLPAKRLQMDDTSPDGWPTVHKNMCSPSNDKHSATLVKKPLEDVKCELYNKGKIVNKARVKLNVCEGEFDGQPWTKKNNQTSLF